MDTELTFGEGKYCYPVGYKCDIELYHRLKKCSDEKDLTAWNQWYAENEYSEKFLQGADLQEMYLENANFFELHLESANLKKSNCKNVNFIESHCFKANFFRAHCEMADFELAICKEAYFRDAYCQDACFHFADCRNADFVSAHCERAKFNLAHCEGASFRSAFCEETHFLQGFYKGASFSWCQCFNAEFDKADCENADFFRSYLGGVAFYKTNLHSTDFSNSKFDQNTMIVECIITDETIFTNTNVSAVVMEPGSRAKIEQIIRKESWGKWYAEQNIFLRCITKFFWHISDYGYSTIRIFKWFFLLIILFSFVYTFFPEMLSMDQSIYCEPNIGRFFRMVNFATATMVTLGFSNINVCPGVSWPSYAGTLVVTANLLVGYFMLAVLVTRLAVLFQTLGPGTVIKLNKFICPSKGYENYYIKRRNR